MKDLFLDRTKLIRGIILVASFLLLARLFFIQVLSGDYKKLSRNNVVKEITIYPTRGLIYDRNNELLVYNRALYDIMVIPRQVKALDTAQFCNLLGIDKLYFKQQLKKCKRYSRYKPSVFLKQVSQDSYLKFQEYLYQFEGFYGQVRTIRHYPHASAAHVLGDLGEVSPKDLTRDEYYTPGDYIGKNGIELYYEDQLRGEKGMQYILVDVHNRSQGDFNEGELNQQPKSGANVVTTIDIDLQQYGERLMQGKVGSIVAIEPQTGEILAMVSGPTFDPNLLCGRTRGKNFNKLKRDSLSPLFNRPIMAQLPPGSTFKAFVALAALGDSSIRSNFYHYCGGFYRIPGYNLKCSHGHASAQNLQEALMHSCNPYFWQTFRNTLDRNKYPRFQDSYNSWREKMLGFGLGKRLAIDLPGEKGGNIPDTSYYDRMYGKRGWRSSTIISLGIGQGEIETTPLQLANSYATIANKGYYFTPHLIKEFKDDDGNTIQAVRDTLSKFETGIPTNAFEPVIEGLFDVVQRGTGVRSRMRNIEMCGKTGTAQNPHGEDHSIFAGFAPKDNPKIAVAVMIENAGGGSKYAAPVASLIMEKYLTDSIADYRGFLEQSILEAEILP